MRSSVRIGDRVGRGRWHRDWSPRGRRGSRRRSDIDVDVDVRVIGRTAAPTRMPPHIEVWRVVPSRQRHQEVDRRRTAAGLEDRHAVAHLRRRVGDDLDRSDILARGLEAATLPGRSCARQRSGRRRPGRMAAGPQRRSRDDAPRAHRSRRGQAAAKSTERRAARRISAGRRWRAPPGPGGRSGRPRSRRTDRTCARAAPGTTGG